MKRLVSLFFLLLIGCPAFGQTFRIFSTTQTSGTISVTNTFQVALAAPTGKRNGCLIQNQGANKMFVFFGPSASATLAKSFQLLAGQTISCGTQTDVVVQDIVNITGTSGDAYVVSSQ